MARKSLLPVLLAGLLFVGLGLSSLAGQEKKGAEEKRGGTVIGTVAAKAANWIEVKADGEDKARKYVPNWVGGAPAQGGGFDKGTLKKIAETPVGARVKLEWKFEERPRVVKIEVLQAPKKDEKK